MHKVQVYKFGGASVKDGEGVTNVAEILSSPLAQKTVVVVSATGKTTNALETVVDLYLNDGDAMAAVEAIKLEHMSILQSAGITDPNAYNAVNDAFVEIEWVLEDDPADSYDYLYDQIVSVGELVSSHILHAAVKKEGVSVCWLDVRDCLWTNDIHREAKVDWEMTQKRLSSKVNTLFEKYDVIITQGFIASTSDNQTTTLGREGSDYTAAIFAYCCDAESVTVYKDVPGVLTGDPRRYKDVSLIESMSYQEAIEMTYYGAKVIHPKTIKPLQNKGIPMYVRSFIDPSGEGTKISNSRVDSYPPIIVVEDNQALVQISVKDFSFVAEDHLKEIFDVITDCRLKVNMMRNTAISFTLVLGADDGKLFRLKDRLDASYHVDITEDLNVITIRHFDDEILNREQKGKEVLFEDRLDETIQMVVRQS